jgi:DNA-binding transcriptional regulator YhcF (GntR family)
MASRQKDRTQRPADLETLAQAVRAVRKRAGLSKSDLQVGITDTGHVLARGERGQNFTQLRARTAGEVLDSFDDPDQQDFWGHPVWKGAELEDLRAWFKEARRSKSEKARAKRAEQRTPEPAPQTARGYAALPYLVIDRVLPILPDTALRVYCALLRHEGYKSGKAWPGQERLATMTGLSETAVWRGITILCEAGLVTSRRRFGTSNEYGMIAATSANIEEIVARLNVNGARKKREGRKLSTKRLARMRQARSRSLHQ